MANPLSAAEPQTFTIKPIGKVQKADNRTLIVLEEKYAPGLLGLDQWSHVQVIRWFDTNDTPQKRAKLQVPSSRRPRQSAYRRFRLPRTGSPEPARTELVQSNFRQRQRR